MGGAALLTGIAGKGGIRCASGGMTWTRGATGVDANRIGAGSVTTGTGTTSMERRGGSPELDGCSTAAVF